MFRYQCRNCGDIQSSDSPTPNQCEVCTIDASFFQTIVVSDDEITSNSLEVMGKDKIQCRNCAEFIEVQVQQCPYCYAKNKAITADIPKKKPNSFIFLN